MNPEDLAAIEARANAATPGPWEVVQPKDGPSLIPGIYSGDLQLFAVGRFWNGAEGGAGDEDNASFVAAARTDVTALLAEVKRLNGFDRDWREIQASLQEQVGELHATIRVMSVNEGELHLKIARLETKLAQIGAECGRVAAWSPLAITGILEIVRS